MRMTRRGGPSVGRWLPVVLVAGLILGACGGSEAYVPAGIVRTPPPDVSGVALPDVSNGGVVTFQGAPGGLLVVYWGYTSCPDICPTTMADLRRALRDLGDPAAVVDVAMVTVDPDRDTPDVLTAYVHAFFPEGMAVRTEDAAALAEAAEPFGATYGVTTNPDGFVEVEHTAFLYAVDESGRIRVTWPFGTSSDDIRRDLEALLKEESNV